MFFYDKEVTDEIFALCKRHRNYKAYDADWGIVKKVWNHGMGALEFIRVYRNKGVLAVNKCVYNKTDERKIDELKKLLGGEWRIVWCEYGYPSFYNNSFSLKFAIDENERN